MVHSHGWQVGAGCLLGSLWALMWLLDLFTKGVRVPKVNTPKPEKWKLSASEGLSPELGTMLLPLYSVGQADTKPKLGT